MNGPVPVGCCVAYVPVGWKTPSASTLPWFAPYLFIAVGLSMENDGSDSPAMNDADGDVRLMVTLDVPCAAQLLNRLPFGAPDFGSYFLNPPKMVCQ
jgi:hypothetical protein